MSPQPASRRNGVDGDSRMPIAVVGMSCRLSGIASNPERLWQMLSRGLSGWSNNASSRFRMDAFWHPQASFPGSFDTRGFHLIKQDPALFDNAFFGINNIEAKAIDPQQRLLLEVAYEAFENAGFPMENLEGSDTGVYCAVSTHDYDKILGRDPELSPGYRFTGTGIAFVSNRISYIFDLHGPSFTLDTGCSGGLVAVHEACKAIAAGEVTQALVGGTNLILDPDQVTAMSSMQFLSPQGRCYSFDSRANGYGRGEGVAAIMLKRLDVALRDNDPIRAIIRGSNVCSDGRTPGVTMPSCDIQAKMIRRAYDQAGISPIDTTYVEAHGTGTTVGDKIEATALNESFCKGRQKENTLFIGSAKSNLGHTESVAGLVGLIKTVLILEKKMIPPNATFIKPSSKVPLEAWGMEVPKKMLNWPQNAPRRASVNSFGYGGTNAHVILEATDEYLDDTIHERSLCVENCTSEINGVSPDIAPKVADTCRHVTVRTAVAPDQSRMEGRTQVNGHSLHQTSLSHSTAINSSKARLFPFSHSHEGGVAKLAANFKRFISDNLLDTDESMDSLAFTLSHRRSFLEFRFCVTACSRDELVEELEKIAMGSDRLQRYDRELKLCFAFTGQGAQWAGMGRQLLVTYPVFAKSMEQSENHLIRLGASWRLLAELGKPKEASRINEATLSQPCCTAIQIALVDLLKSWGIRPAIVCGHSSGEIAAAYAAGILTAEDCLKVAYFRGHSVKLLKEQNPTLSGGMLAVGLSASEAQEYIDDDITSGKVVVACINSPSSVTLSGDEAALNNIQAKLAARDVFHRKLVVGVAYHSYHMEIILEEYLHAIQDIKPPQCERHIQMVSSVTGQAIQGEELDAAYWGTNLTSPVLFDGALTEVLRTVQADQEQSSSLAVVEVGPHSALGGPIKQIIKASKLPGSITYHSVLSRNQDTSRTAIGLAGDLFSKGATVNLREVNDPHGSAKKNVLTNLPTYNWHHNTAHWVESRRSVKYRHRIFPRHDLFGVPSIDSVPTEPTWRNYIRLEELPWLKGHCIGGEIVFPAAGYIAMVLEALKQQVLCDGNNWKNMRVKFRQVNVGRALLVPDSSVGVETVTSIRPYTYTARESSASWKEFRIFSVSTNGESTEHSRGLVAAINPSPNEQQRSMTDLESLEFIEEASKSSRVMLSPTQLYKELRGLGIEYSGPFESQEQIRASESGSTCRIKVPNVKAIMPSNHQQPHCVHPATLDLCFQAVFSAMKVGDNLRGTIVLSGIDDLEIWSEIPSQPGKGMSIATSLRSHGHSKFISDLIVSSSESDTPEVFIKAKGLTFARTSGLSRQNATERPVGESLCHRLEWALDPTCAKPQSIIERCVPDSSYELKTGITGMYEQYCRAVIEDTLTKLSPDDEGKITGHLFHLLRWMRSIRSDSHESLRIDNALNTKIKSLGIHGEVLVDVATQLPHVLRREVDPLALLLEKDRLYRLYKFENADRCHEQLAKYIKLMQFKNSNLRILEIGAGTASTSMPILEALYNSGVSGKTRRETYTFTDISTGFFQKAAEKLEKFQESLEFKRLDIEISPKEQGFELGSYDLIIASNVLHATCDINNTLGNVRSLLKPNGQLALMEITAPKIHTGLIFGMLPGWWLGIADGRVSSPLLGLSDWHDRLRCSGFSGINLQMQDYGSAEDHEISVIISSATSHPVSLELGLPNPMGGESSAPECASLELKSRISTPPAAQQGPIGSLSQTIVVISGNQEDDSIADHMIKLLASSKPSVHIKKSALAQAELFDNQLAVVLLEAVSPFIATCSKSEWEKVQCILANAGGVLWVTCGGVVESANPLQSLIVGLTRCLRSENQSAKVVTLDLEPNHGSGLEVAEQIMTVFDHAFGSCAPQTSALLEFEYAVRNGEVIIPRLINDNQVDEYVKDSTSTYHPQNQQSINSGRALSLKIHEPGLLNSLYWADSERHSRKIRAEEVRVELQYASLNFKDIMTAMGQLDGHTAMLLEGSGKVVEVGEALCDQYAIGDLVYVTDLPDGLATTSVIDKWNVHNLPKKLSMEVATAVSTVYATALYSLRNVANLQEGESILVHSGAGAVGQAAISLAQYLKAGHIFVTVGSAEKREFIREHFQIPDENIFSSRGLDFSDQILRKTKYHGVDVVLNSLSGDALQESCSLLAPFGRFVEIGKKDLISNARLEIGCLEKNAMFATVDLALLAKRKPAVYQNLYHTVLGLVGQGKIKILSPITVNGLSELEASFRLMQAGKHMGKLLLRFDTEMTIPVQPQQPPAPELKRDCSYLVVGGAGGLGRATIKHLARLGAKQIITLSRSGPDSQLMRELVEEMRVGGVNLVVCKGSVTDTVAIASIKEQSREFPIRGIIQGAMVLQDSRMDNMSYEQWRAAMEPKVMGTMNLHQAFGNTLDFFILLSSGAGIIGSYAQGNYAAGNTFQDSLARHRASLGLPARSIDVGAVEEYGYTAENQDSMEFVIRQGLRPYKAKEFLATISEAIRNPLASDPSVAQLLCGTSRADPNSSAKEASLQRPDLKFSHMWTKHKHQASSKAESRRFDISAALGSATTADEAEKATQVAIRMKLSSLLALPADELRTDRSVSSYGIDSLIAVELRNWILTKLEAHVQIFELMSSITFAELSNMIARRSRLVAPGFFGEDK